MKKQIKARTLLELKAKVYAVNGWKRQAGESAATRIKAMYNVTLDQKGNMFVATLRDAGEPQSKSIQERWARLTS
jgi:hypothetical protein